MAQVKSSPGVPNVLPTVVASSATPILAGPPIVGVIGTNDLTTETTNIWASVVTASAITIPFSSSTSIILGPIIFSGSTFVVGGV